MAEKFGLQFFEVSAKENINISEMFHFIAKEIKDKILGSEVLSNNRSLERLRTYGSLTANRQQKSERAVAEVVLMDVLCLE